MSEAREQFDGLRQKFEELIEQIKLSELADHIRDMTEQTGGLSEEIAKIRSRGYAFAASLETKIGGLNQQWAELRPRLPQLISQEANRLRDEADKLKDKLESAGKILAHPAALQKLIPDVEQAVSDIESGIESAVSKVQELYAGIQEEVEEIAAKFQDINWYLDQQDEASFAWQSDEKVYMATKAEWVATGKGKDDPDGILYLTDQRLVFEQKETTGKTLGLFGGKKVQEMEWGLALNLITGVKTENKGFFGGRDMVYLTLGEGAPHSEITLEVKGSANNEEWAKQIQRAISGELQAERVG
jgi:regulator of replication initiation timing